MAALDSLLPEYRAQYESLMPEIERKVRGDLVRRGMNQSGEAGDALARAQAKLLAELAGESARARMAQEEAAAQRRFQGEQGDANRSEAARAQRLGLIGSAVGGLGTLGAMYAMRPGANANINIVPLANGKHGAYNPATGTIQEIPMEGGEGGEGGFQVRKFGHGEGESLPAAPKSMWQKAGGFGGLAAGATGGLLGSQFAGLAAGRDTGTSGALGAGLGGLAGYGLGMTRFGGSPWAAGLGALLGSTGGGLLGNLFK